MCGLEFVNPQQPIRSACDERIYFHKAYSTSICFILKDYKIKLQLEITVFGNGKMKV